MIHKSEFHTFSLNNLIKKKNLRLRCFLFYLSSCMNLVTTDYIKSTEFMLMVDSRA